MNLDPHLKKLKQAIEEENCKKLQGILELGIDLEAIILNDLTPLEYATELAKTKSIKMLCLSGANVNIINNNQSLLTKAVYLGKIDVVKTIVAMGANLDYKNSADEWTALMEAIALGYIDIAKFLIESGASICLPNLDNHTALNIAIMEKQWKLIEFMIPFLPSYDSSLACDRQYAEEWLELARNYKAKRLKEAACKGYNSVFRKILQSITLSPQDMGSALIYCARYGNLDGVRILINSGADFSTKDENKKTALDYARQKNYSEIITLLEQTTSVKD